MSQEPRLDQTVRQLPVKWVLAIVGILIVYAITQPILNQRLGWNLPSIGSVLGEADRAGDTRKSDGSDKSTPVGPSSRNESKPPEDLGKDSSGASTTSATNESKKISGPQSESLGQSRQLSSVLKETSKDHFVSPAGLVYGPGGEEGHRIKHLQRHLEDQPNRPGKHGVFDGDMVTVIERIDEAFQRAQRRDKGTTTRYENGRTVIEANFDKPIGFIGGRDGRRDKNPPARKLRLEVEDKEVITAFPF